MIILRIAIGRGWTKETVMRISSTLVFALPLTTQTSGPVAFASIAGEQHSNFSESGGVPTTITASTLAKDSSMSLKQQPSSSVVGFTVYSHG